MQRVPQCVTVVAARYGDRLWGITVSSFTSVSLNPPLILVCISKSSPTHEALIHASGFAVNLLSAEQAVLSDLFARKEAGAVRFEGIRYRPGKLGAPLLEGAAAFLECRRWRVYPAGDHSIIFGEVVHSGLNLEADPLVYHKQGYTRLEKTGNPR